MLPADFLRTYSSLFSAALKADGGESSRAKFQEEAAKVGKKKVLGKNGNGPTVQGGAKRFKRNWVIQDERMLALKTRMDKRIRSLAREIYEEMLDIAESSGASVLNRRTPIGLQCCSCKMFIDTGWKYCPQCGHNQSQAV